MTGAKEMIGKALTEALIERLYNAIILLLPHPSRSSPRLMYFWFIKMTRTSIILRIVSAIILFAFGFLLYRKFASWFLIDRPGIIYLSDSLGTIWRHALVFSACFAFIPLGSILLDLRKTKNISTASLILLLCIIAGILIKRALLARNIKYILSEGQVSEERIEYSLTIDAVLPDLYMVCSLIIGLCLLIVLKRIRALFRNDSDESNNNLVSKLLSK